MSASIVVANATLQHSSEVESKSSRLPKEIASENSNQGDNEDEDTSKDSEEDGSEETQDYETTSALSDGLNKGRDNNNHKNETERQDYEDQVDDDLERRAFLIGKGSITNELKKLKNSRKRLFSRPRKKRKKRKKILKGASIKSTQTRQGTTTVGYGNIEGLQQQVQQQQPSGLMAATFQNKPISSVMKQHLSSLSNSLQLSSAVQKLLVGKLNPNGNNSPSSANRYQQMRPSNELGLSAQNDIFLKQQTNGFNDGGSRQQTLDHLLAQQHQWALTEEMPSYSPMESPLRSPEANKMIPVEIVGLDPSVANSILYTNHTMIARNPGSMYASNGEMTSNSLQRPELSYLQQPMHPVGSQRAPAVFHIHHFHRDKPPEVEQQQQIVKHQTSELEHNEVSNHGDEDKSQQDVGGSTKHPDTEIQQPQQQLKAYVNEKGQLVYLQSFEEQNADSGSNPEEEQDKEHRVSEFALPTSGLQGPQQKYVEQQETGQTKQELGQTSGSSAESSGPMEATSGIEEPEKQEDNAKVSGHVEQNPNHNPYLNPSSNYANNSKYPGPNRGSKSLQTDAKNRVYLIGGQPANLVKSPTDTATIEDSNGQQFLMVSYKPQSNKPEYVNEVDEPIIANHYRNPYNDVQESKFAPLSASSNPQQSLLMGSSSLLRLKAMQEGNRQQEVPSSILENKLQLLRNHASTSSKSIMDQRPYWNQTVYGSDSNHPIPTSNQFDHYRAKLHGQQQTALQTLQYPSSEQFYPFPNQVPANPFANQIIDTPFRIPNPRQPGFGNLYNNATKTELASVPTATIVGSMSDDKFSLSNIYADKILNGIKNNSLSLQSHQNFIESLALLKHLQQVTKVQQQKYPTIPSRLNDNQHHPLENSTKLSTQELLTLLQDLKSNSNQVNNGSVVILPISSHSSNNGGYLDVGGSDSSTRQGRFELAQASNDSPPKYTRNDANRTSSSQANFKQLYMQPKLIGSSKQDPNIPVESFSHGFSGSGGTSKSRNTLEEHEMLDTSGLSNIALAFIFLVSLMTLTIIADTNCQISPMQKASMIYRHRRRSFGRCSDLPGRTRLTLTERTKRFMRSNFVNNDGTSMKSSDTGTTFAKGTSSSPINLGQSDGSRIATMHKRNTNTDNESYGQSLSTFTGAPISTNNNKSQFQQPEQDATVKTLNTRLNKPSYLKSLISVSSDCSTSRKQQQLNQDKSNKSNDNSCYLNVRGQPTANLPMNKQMKLSKGSIEDRCKRNHSFKKMMDNENNQDFGIESSQRSGDNSRLRSNDLKQPSTFNRLSTIHSVGDSDTTSSPTCGNVNLVKRRLDAVSGKLPAPKYIVAGMNLDRPPDPNCVNRL